MLGCSRRQKEADIRPEQKWDFISLNDFKSTSCLTTFAYAYLWISLFISCAVYGVDTFTAVNLLAFNRWSGEVEPYIPFSISRWIFSACIIASWVNLAFEHIRAMRVMKRGAVAESYLDSLAVRLQCVRMGKQGRGWRRFLVFAELTKSKKGVEYVALFTYFSFQSWIRVIFCQGPRQVTNALTLYSVFKANLDPSDATDVGSALTTFFKNVGILAEQEHQQAVILSGMVFTLIIWVFAALSLILAMLFYLLFLWHYIPNADGGLSGYCERKINGRLSKIVSVKVNKAIEEEERKRIKAETKAAKKGDKPAPVGRQATIPTLFANDDKLPKMPMLNRNDTMATLPLYESRPGTPNGGVPGFELNHLDQKRPAPSRNGTNTSFASNAPLMSNASDMGYGRSASPAPSIPSLPALNTNNFQGGPQRSMTGSSNNPNFYGPQGGPPRMPSAFGDRGYTESPVSYNNQGPPNMRNDSMRNDPMRNDSMRNDSMRSNYVDPRMADFAGGPRSNTPLGHGSAPSLGRRTPFVEMGAGGRQSPAPFQAPYQGSENGRSSPAPSLRSQAPSAYQSYNPSQQRAPSNPMPAPYTSPPQQQRNMTDPGGLNYFNGGGGPMPAPARSATGMTARIPDMARLASPAPYNNNSNGVASPMGPPMNGGYRR